MESDLLVLDAAVDIMLHMFPVAVLAIQLALVEGPDGLPVDEGTQEVLCRKLCVLEADLSGVMTLISVWASLSGIHTIFKTLNRYI